jgi:malonyl-CoA decarboxylase
LDKKEEILAEAQKLIDAKNDPVARFHMGNGAKLHRLNWMADDSKLRAEQSFGMMCNYTYN